MVARHGHICLCHTPPSCLAQRLKAWCSSTRAKVQQPNLHNASLSKRNPDTRVEGFDWGCTERFNPYFKSQTSSVATAGPVASSHSPSTLEEFIAALLVRLQNLSFESKSRSSSCSNYYLQRWRDRLCGAQYQ